MEQFYDEINFFDKLVMIKDLELDKNNSIANIQAHTNISMKILSYTYEQKIFSLC